MEAAHFFEGTEKLLEVWFSRQQPDANQGSGDLRTIPRWVLGAVAASKASATGGGRVPAAFRWGQLPGRGSFRWPWRGPRCWGWGAAASTRGASRLLPPPLLGRPLPGGRGGGRRAACSGNVSRAACGAAGGASRGGLWARAVRLSPPELAVRGPGWGRFGAARAASRQVWLGRLSQALIWACPSRRARREGASLKPGSVSPRAAGGGGSPGLGLRVWRAGLPPAVRAGSMWRPGGGDWAGAVSQWLGPTAALTCSAPNLFGAAPGDGRGAHRGLPPRLLTLGV